MAGSMSGFRKNKVGLRNLVPENMKTKMNKIMSRDTEVSLKGFSLGKFGTI